MNKFTITSRKFNRTVTFWHDADAAEGRKTGNIWCDLNGQEGTLGIQLCTNGNRGDTLRVTEENARRVANRWLNKFLGAQEDE